MKALVESYEAYFYIESISGNDILVSEGVMPISVNIGRILLNDGVYVGDEYDTSIPNIMKKIKDMGFKKIDNKNSSFESAGVFEKNFVKVVQTDQPCNDNILEYIEKISGKDIILARKILGNTPIMATGWYQTHSKDFKTVQKVTFEKYISYRDMMNSNGDPFGIIIGNEIPVEHLSIKSSSNGFPMISVNDYGPLVEDGCTGNISYQLASVSTQERVARRNIDVKLSTREVKESFGEKNFCFFCWLIGLFKKLKNKKNN